MTARRERPHGYFLVEDCRRETIAPLFRGALNRGRGQVHHGHLQNFDRPYSIYLSTADDFAGSWLRIGNAGDNAGFPLSVDRFVRWKRKQGWMKPNPNFGVVVRKVEGYKPFVVGLDHTRYEYLLMTPTNLIGTRGDLDTQFLGRTLSRNQLRFRRRRQLVKSILPWVSDDWIADQSAWWPNRWDKPNGGNWCRGGERSANCATGVGTGGASTSPTRSRRSSIAAVVVQRDRFIPRWISVMTTWRPSRASSEACGGDNRRGEGNILG